ncbi:hypothetical protein GCM10007877_21470 [Marinibactrum halimedae]|uniref:Uncharacterized protein n=1 Tax=Marinibactrum halimedae TaxID=1444977 RepID=A0AA37T5Z4_9GAMM|nr:hypothetical protein GCM10007877_21470 [Marinibactrum halimedae]
MKKYLWGQDSIKNLLITLSLNWDKGFPHENYCEEGGKLGNIPVKIDGTNLSDF